MFAKFKIQGALSYLRSQRKFRALKAGPRPLSGAGGDTRVLHSLKNDALISTVQLDLSRILVYWANPRIGLSPSKCRLNKMRLP